jgi:hypothetical protein
VRIEAALVEGGAFRVLENKNDGLSLRKVATLLATHDRVVSRLMNGKQLASYRALNPVNRCPQTLRTRGGEEGSRRSTSRCRRSLTNGKPTSWLQKNTGCRRRETGD